MFQKDNLLKLPVLLLPCKKSNLSIGTLRLVHTLPQQSHTDPSVCSVHYVNYLVSQFEFLTQAFGHCRYHHCGQTFLSIKFLCCIHQLIPQSQKLPEIRLSHCKILNKLELFVVIFLENFEFYIQVVEIFFGSRKLSKSFLAFAKVHIVGTS